MDFGQGRKSFSKPLLLSYRLSLSTYLTGPIRVGQNITFWKIDSGNYEFSIVHVFSWFFADNCSE